MQKRAISNNKLKNYRIRVLSRHGTHSILRHELPKMEKRALIRLGSTTDLAINGREYIEINSIQAIKNSASKLLMKQCFDKAAVKTAKWFPLSKTIPEGFQFPLVIKSHYGSRGEGNTLIQNKENYDLFITHHNVNNYIVESFLNMSREYRLHVTKNGCFYTCRKMLKNDIPKEKRWVRNDSTVTWILEENPLFDKPVNWNLIVADCIKALESLSLDVAAFDVKVQSAKDNKERNRESPEWAILESCSAPSLGNITAQKYLEIIPKLIKDKIANNI